MDVETASFQAVDGVTLRGDLHRPDADDPVGGVVMVHGFSATKEMALPVFADAIAAAGIAVLRYDHRNFGASGGEPRGEIDPWAQARDLRAALTWLGEQPGVDRDRLGLWGTSFGGGGVLAVAACDDRVRAVVANVPFAATAEAGYADDDGRFEDLREALLDESGDGPADAAGESVGPIPVVTEGPGPDGFLADPESAAWFLAEGRRPGSGWRNEVRLRDASGSGPPFDPGVCVAHIAPTPLLMVVATEDQVAPVGLARAAFERAGEPKQLVEVEGHHFSPYAGPGLETAAGAAATFFAETLATAR